MKKLILIACAVVFTLAANAQLNPMLGSNGLATDTVTDTGTETWTLAIPGSQKTIGVQIAITKISGTVGGSVVLQVSADGTTFTTTASSSQTPTNVASQSFIWEVTDSKWQYYRILFTGTGTMVASATAKAIVRKN